MRQRRRVERGRFAAIRDRSQPVVSRRDVEHRQRKLLLIGAGIALTIVVVLVGAALFVGLFQPPRKVVSTVAGDDVRLSELVTYTSLAALESGETGTISVANYERDNDSDESLQ